MNARHLCRGKRVDTGDWVQGNILHSSPDEMFIVELFSDGRWFTVPREVCGSLLQVDPATVGNCTGLEDKNGKLIFEGDRVQRKCHIFTLGQKAPTGERMMVGTVIWDDNRSKEAGSWAVDSYDEHGNPAKYILLADMEIIGTIHDTPELLGGGEA